MFERSHKVEVKRFIHVHISSTPSSSFIYSRQLDKTVKWVLVSFQPYIKYTVRQYFTRNNLVLLRTTLPRIMNDEQRKWRSSLLSTYAHPPSWSEHMNASPGVELCWTSYPENGSRQHFTRWPIHYILEELCSWDVPLLAVESFSTIYICSRLCRGPRYKYSHCS